MSFVSDVVVYICIWVVVFFAALPVGVRTEESPQVGNARSAPIKPNLGKKAFWTSVISAVIWIFYAYIQSLDIISFRQ